MAEYSTAKVIAITVLEAGFMGSKSPASVFYWITEMKWFCLSWKT